MIPIMCKSHSRKSGISSSGLRRSTRSPTRPELSRTEIKACVAVYRISKDAYDVIKREAEGGTYMEASNRILRENNVRILRVADERVTQ